MEAQTEFSFVYITTASREDALAISHSLLSERLIACANLHEHVTSMYRWQGEIEHAHETVIFAKTRSALVPQVIERVKKLHSYKTPCIVSMPITEGNPAYLQWLAEETAAKS